VTEEPTTLLEGGPSACPFLAFEDDRDHRSSKPDYRNRCFAAPEPEPRATPHQEHYCLSADFARCPVFLDWARQEAAVVRVAGAPTMVRASGVADGVAAATAAGDAAATGLLAGRLTSAPNTDTAPSSRRTADASATLWSYDGEGKRSKGPAAPLPPSSLAEPAIAMARRGPSHPGWETPPRLENFPRLRSREDRRTNQPLLFAAVGVSLIMLALALFPIVTSSKGTTAGGSGLAESGAVGSGAMQSAGPSGGAASAAPRTTFFQYVIKSGDQMWAIARVFNIQLQDLIDANPQIKDPNHLEVGQALNIPPPGWHATPSPGASAKKS
jgi:LysM repeat protein